MKLLRFTCTAFSLAAFAGINSLAVASESDNKTFIEDAIKGDNSEMELGQLAQRKAESDRVRQFGRTLAQDLEHARSEAVDVARSLGVTPPDQLSDKAQREYEKLQNLSGLDFDREFIRYMIQDHQEDIRDFRREARSGTGDARRLAEKQLPTLEKHLSAAKMIQDREGKRRS